MTLSDKTQKLIIATEKRIEGSTENQAFNHVARCKLDEIRRYSNTSRELGRNLRTYRKHLLDSAHLLVRFPPDVIQAYNSLVAGLNKILR